jgi:hypothetical protein
LIQFTVVVIIFRYVSKGRRLLKNQQLIEELEKSLDDKVEKEKLGEGLLGYIICSTQVINVYLCFSLTFCFAITFNSTNLVFPGGSSATTICLVCC